LTQEVDEENGKERMRKRKQLPGPRSTFLPTQTPEHPEREHASLNLLQMWRRDNIDIWNFTHSVWQL
jgi:hypothetical protein